MNLSVSNLAWGDVPLPHIAPLLRAAGVEGVEIAPTAVWPEAPDVDDAAIRRLQQSIDESGLAVSGVQSLLYGHPELQLLDSATWPALHEHLRRVLGLAGSLGADVAVFGSPRNRTRGRMSVAEADGVAAEFLTGLLPVLEANGVVLTLEPNAPAYGADYLTGYRDAVRLADLIGSQWVQPQIDTGCLAMVGEDPAEMAQVRTPGHVHVSAPQLKMPPGELDHRRLVRQLREAGYTGWVVLEMLQVAPDVQGAAVRAAEWLVSTYRDEM